MDNVADNLKRIWNTPEEHHLSPNVADNFNTSEEHHHSPNVADNFNTPEAAESDDMDIDDDCMQTRLSRDGRYVEGESYKVRNQRYEKKRGHDWKAHDKTLMKRKRCFHKTLVEFMCQFYHLRHEGTMGRIFKQLDYLVDKGEDIRRAVKKVVNNHKYKFDVLFEDTYIVIPNKVTNVTLMLTLCYVYVYNKFAPYACVINWWWSCGCGCGQVVVVVVKWLWSIGCGCGQVVVV